MDNSAADLPGATSSPWAPVPLGGQQKIMFEALGQRDSVSAAIYVGAIQVWGDATNPDRLALAAHGIRELMDRLSKYLDVPYRDQPRMGDKVAALYDAWQRARPQIGAGLPMPDGILKKLEGFFEWYESDRPNRRALAGSMLRKMDPAARPMPFPIEDLRVNEWMTCHDFFANSAHHTQNSAGDFEGWLDVLERFLLDRMRPRTFDNADALDDLIREGEGDA